MQRLAEAEHGVDRCAGQDAERIRSAFVNALRFDDDLLDVLRPRPAAVLSGLCIPRKRRKQCEGDHCE